ncbi:MAG: hypothetical protein ACLUSX_12400 [Ruminococcus sp.]|uniref:hypothetical protein n=1 Tax=Oscillospiraceae TaxID=216572 RepID=UPI003995BA9E
MNIVAENPSPRKYAAKPGGWCDYVAVCAEQLAGVETSDMARRTASCSKVFPSSFSPEKKLVTR